MFVWFLVFSLGYGILVPGTGIKPAFPAFEEQSLNHRGVPDGASGKAPACQCKRHEMQVRSLGQKDPLEEGMATHSSFFCLENPLDRGAWQATVDRVAKSWTQLKRLSMHAR